MLDCQGNIRRLIDTTTNVISATYDYSAFGEQKFSNMGVFNPWQYASKRFDQDLGLIDFGKRLYDPLLGRWLSTDPAGFINGQNLYQYNFNNPFRYTDPDGRFVFFIPILFGTFGAGVGEAAVVGGVTAFAIEITLSQVIVGSIVTAATIWGINEGLKTLVKDLMIAAIAPVCVRNLFLKKLKEGKKLNLEQNRLI